MTSSSWGRQLALLALLYVIVLTTITAALPSQCIPSAGAIRHTIVQGEEYSPWMMVDVDGDGDNDVVASAGGELVWLENRGGAIDLLSPVSIVPFGLVTGYREVFDVDVDRDGVIDFVFRALPSYAAWVRNTGGGSFDSPVAIMLESTFSTIAVGNADGDGWVDVLLCERVSVRLAFNNNGSFETTGETLISSLQQIQAGAIGDLDGDSLGDIILGYNTRNDVHWYRNIDGRSFEGSLRIIASMGFGSSIPVLADLDNDGDMDVLSWWINSGTGSFSGEQVFAATSTKAQKPLVADLDNNGAKDVAVADGSYVSLVIASAPGVFAPSVTANVDVENAYCFGDIDGDNVLEIASKVDSAPPPLAFWRWDGTPANWIPITQQIVDTTNSRSMAIGDFDLDGDVDLVVMAVDSGTVPSPLWWLENDGRGEYISRSMIVATAEKPRSVDVADVNADGADDLIVYMDGIIGAMLNNGSGHFGPLLPAVTISVANDLQAWARLDMDGDGMPDIVVVPDVHAPWLWARWNDTGYGPALAFPHSTLQDSAVRMTAADMDGDGRTDLLSWYVFGTQIEWYSVAANNGTLSSPVVIPIAAGVGVHVAAADFDLDGHIDLAVDTGSKLLVILLSTGDGGLSFHLPQAVARWTSTSVNDFVATDADGDGFLDLVFSASSRAHIVFGAARVDEMIQAVWSNSAWAAIAVADIDGNGARDIVALQDRVGLVWFENSGPALRAMPATRATDTTFIDSGTTSLGKPSDFALADVDADGDLDYIGTYSSFDTIVWFENVNDASGLWLIHSMAVNLDCLSLVVRDFDNDGDLDAVAADLLAPALVLLRNDDGVGGSWSTITVVDGFASADLTAIDANSNGLPDLLAVSSVQDSARIWFNNGDGSFTAGIEVSASFRLARVAVGDVDDDGVLDFVISASTGAYFTLFLNVNATFAKQTVAMDHVGKEIKLADMDLDGHVDIIVLRSSAAPSVLLFPNIDGSGALDPDLVILVATSDGIFFVENKAGVFVRRMPILSPSGVSDATLQLGDIDGNGAVEVVFSHDLDPGVYSCMRDTHIPITRPIHIRARIPGTVTFDCDGGVLFRVRPHPSPLVDSVGELTLEGIHIKGTGIAANSLHGATGLRVEGRGAVLTLVNCSIVAAAAVHPPLSVAMVDVGFGGAVAVLGGAQLFAVDTTFSASSAVSAGGAIAARGVGTVVTLSHCVVSGNVAPRGGGVVVLSGARAVLDNSSVVTGNTAVDAGSGNGGGLYIDSSSELAAIHATISDNVAAGIGLGGGLMVEAGGVVSLAKPLLCGNSAGVGGGAIAVLASNLVSRFGLGLASTSLPQAVGDDAAQVGSSTSPTVSIIDGLVRGNIASRFGGGLLVCGVRVAVAGDTGLGWSTNYVREQDDRAAQDVFMCAAAGFDPAGWASDVARVPWLSVATPNVVAGLVIAAPLASVSAVTPLAERVASGGSLGGQVRGLDWLGQGVFEPNLKVRIDITDPTQSVAVSGQPSASLSSATAVSVPAIKLELVAGASGNGVNVMYNVAPEARAADALDVQAHAGIVRVTGCAPGTGGVPGSSGGIDVIVCAVCAAGTFSDETSLAECAPVPTCPSNTIRLAADGSAASNATDTPSGDCVCEKGFWTPGGAANVACAPCPRGGLCPGGAAQPKAAPGFFPDTFGSTLFVACPTASACAGGGSCHPGYRSRLCAQCDDGYYKFGSRCLECETAKNAVVTTLLVLGVTLVCGALLAFNLTEGLRHKFAAAMIGLNALQMSAIYGKLDLDWGPIVRVYFDVASAVNLDMELTSPECSIVRGADVWAVKWILTLLLPVFAAAVVGLVACVYAVLIAVGVRWFETKNMAMLGSAFGRTLFQIVVLLYLPLTSAALAPFGCRRDESGRWQMAADPARSCYNSAWASGLLGPGLVAAGVYAIGVPAAVIVLLRRKRAALDPISFTLRFGFLVGRFSDNAWWFETAIMARKAGVVLCMTLFFTEEGKANAAVFVLLGSLLQLSIQQPYRSQLHNALAIVVLLTTLSILYAGTFDDYALRRGMASAAVAINVLAILGGNAADVWLMSRAEKVVEADEYYVDGVFSNAAQENADAYASVFGQDTDLELQPMSPAFEEKACFVAHVLDSVVAQDLVSTASASDLGTAIPPPPPVATAPIIGNSTVVASESSSTSSSSSTTSSSS
ncbi:uncharacterized protein AMSG_08916 [Thecamonas trahens ATCC 50062]|uniref:DUF7630 domain-containing protein n=1 Tax=Thecamonas trahens ATCC 50062 TaxID=461836 RepID=A0A0L0DMB3_THETB|nr:hypothetical protein AMSG_08916 [Thecamonas trahens ATCC 50062]KNC53410.1 hypothetical protein AMSG_08916 [Thecamonas trahens ATCC 50062]|eukprot:XP_013754449.1 hypothetical protein AMSG_08916 [Thecamonas trahens ATCC 50062]